MDNALREDPAAIDAGRIASGALGRWFLVIVVLALFLFVSAGTLAYWHAWVYTGILGLSSLAFIVYYLNNDPGLIAGRMKVREKEREQRRIQQVSLRLVRRSGRSRAGR
jgi:hypothetical protein